MYSSVSRVHSSRSTSVHQSNRHAHATIRHNSTYNTTEASLPIYADEKRRRSRDRENYSFASAFCPRDDDDLRPHDVPIGYNI